MTGKQRKWVYAGAIAAGAALLVFLAVETLRGLLNVPMLQSFSVTVHNATDRDIVEVEIGIIGGQSAVQYSDGIRSGDKTKFKPDLTVAGEGAIYMKYTDAAGDSRTETVCGYTEHVSGYSNVTLRNGGAEVESDCM